MDIEKIITDNGIKPKEKTVAISEMLLQNKVSLDELIVFAGTSKDALKATCIEAIEFATKKNASIATLNSLHFVSNTLTDKAPRIKWESAKVIGNIAHQFPDQLNAAIKNLLVNTEHAGTVVRWSAAFALGEIVKIKSKKTKDLAATLEAICEREEKNSIKKIYIAALKKIKN